MSELKSFSLYQSLCSAQQNKISIVSKKAVKEFIEFCSNNSNTLIIEHVLMLIIEYYRIEENIDVMNITAFHFIEMNEKDEVVIDLSKLPIKLQHLLLLFQQKCGKK